MTQLGHLLVRPSTLYIYIYVYIYILTYVGFTSDLYQIYVDLRQFTSDIGDIRYINANTMPTHANKMDKTGGHPLFCT